MKQLSLLFIFWFCLIHFSVDAQISIKGRVIESGTNQPIPYVNIFVKGSLEGTQSNFEGYYSFVANKLADSIKASYLGYKVLSKKINKKEPIQTIDFELVKDVTNLNEVVIKAGENPALRIIRKAIQYKDNYNKRRLQNYSYNSYTKLQVFVDNIGPKFRRFRIFRPLVKYYSKLDSAKGDKAKATIPVYFSENNTQIFIGEKQLKSKEMIDAIRLNFVGKKQSFLANQLSGSDLQDYNFNDNNIQLFDKNFLSPIADGALIFYHYRIADTVVIDKDTCYQIMVWPKNKQDLAFTGTIWIADSTYALKQLDLEITKEVNINLIERLSIQQELEAIPTGEHVCKKMNILIDGANLTKNFVSFIFKGYISNKDYALNSLTDTIKQGKRIFAEEALTRKNEYWNSTRHEKLSNEDVINFQIIDTISNIPIIKRGTEAVYFLGTGYKTLGKIDIGSLQSLYARNLIEGDRIKLNLRTNMYMSKTYTARAYIAYGFLDKVYKYNVQIEKIISRFPWLKIGVQHRNDYDQLGVNYSYSRTTSLDAGAGSLYNINSNIFNIGKLVHNIEYRSWLDFDFPRGVSNRVSLQHINSTALFKLTGNKDYLYNTKSITSEIRLDTRISINEYYLQNGNDRVSLGNRISPIITLSFAHGFNNLLGSTFGYDKANIGFKYAIRSGIYGRTNIFFNGGMIFTKVPFIFLESHRGNETYFYSSNVFNTMNFFEFLSDRFASLQLQHHFNGLLLNRIPIIKKLKWRELVTANILYGALSFKNSKFNENKDFSTLERKPYMEAGFGIENIFKIIRVDFLYRLTYTDANYRQKLSDNNRSSIVPFAVKFSLGFGL